MWWFSPSRLRHLAIRFDPRTRDEFRAEVEEYLQRCKQRWLSIAYKKAMEARLAMIELVIVNHGSRNFPATQVELNIPPSVLAFVSEDDPDAVFDPPWRPRPYGDLPHLANLDIPPAVVRSSHEIEFHGDEEVVRFLPVDVRPGRKHRLPELHLAIPAELAGQTLTMTWRATSTGATSWAEGSFEFPVADPPALLGRAGGGNAEAE